MRRRRRIARTCRLYYADKYVAVGVYERDGTTVTVDETIDSARRDGGALEPRVGVGAAGAAVLGWAFEDNPEEKVGPFYALLQSRVATNEGRRRGRRGELILLVTLDSAQDF